MTDSSDSNGHSEFRESKNGSPTSETGSEEAPRAEAKYVGEDKAAPRKVRRTTPSHTRHKKRKVKTRLKKPAGTSSAAFSENLQQLREVFVSFCKPANVMNPDFDMKAVASDPLQLDTIKMNSANFAKFSRDCCMVSVTGEDVSLSRTDVDIIFARQMAKASDRRNISWLQFLECLAPMAEKLDFSFEEFCSAVVQQSRQQLVMRNAVAQRKRQQSIPSGTKTSRVARGKSKKYINKILQPKSRRLSVVERKDDLRTEWQAMTDTQRGRLRQCFCSFCVFAPHRQELDLTINHKMTGTAWAKFCRDCKFLGPKLTVQDVDLLFVKNKSKGKRKITWDQFFNCCVELSVQVDMHVDQFMRAVNMPSLNHITHFDESFAFGKDRETSAPKPLQAQIPGLYKATPVKPARPEEPLPPIALSSESSDDEPYPPTPEPEPLEYPMPFVVDAANPTSLEIMEEPEDIVLQDEEEEVDTQWLLKSLMSVAEDDGMLSAQEKQWIGGYSKIASTTPEASEDDDSEAEAELEAAAASVDAADLAPIHLDEAAQRAAPAWKAIMSPIERVQQIKERWSRRRDELLAERAQRESLSPPKSPVQSPRVRASLSSAEASPEFTAAIALASSSAPEVDDIAASLLLECWAGNGDGEGDASGDADEIVAELQEDIESSTPAQDLQALAETLLS